MSLLSNGINRCSALDLAYIKSRFSLLRNLDPVQRSNDACQPFNGIFPAEIIKGVSSFRAHCDLKSLRSHSLVYDLIQLAVKGTKSCDPTGLILAYVPDAL